MGNTLLTNIYVISKLHSEWVLQNPILTVTQAAFSTDTKELKIGNGTSRWSDLPVDTTHGTTFAHSHIHHVGGRDYLSPESIAAADRIHTHTAEECNSAPLDMNDLIPVEYIPNIDASKITSGVLNKDRLPSATLSDQGAVRLNNTLTSTSTVQALTANQGKVLKDLVDTKQVNLGYTPENTANKNIANGYVGLDASGKISESHLPSISIVDVYSVSSQAEMLTLSSARRGDICIRDDLSKTFILALDGYSTLANWKELRTPTDSVLSVAGKTGAVTLSTTDVAPTTSRQYVTSANLTVINNTSGTNTGDETSDRLGTLIHNSELISTPIATDELCFTDSQDTYTLKRMTWQTFLSLIYSHVINTITPDEISIYKKQHTVTIAADANVVMSLSDYTGDLEYLLIDIKFRDTNSKLYNAIGVVYYELDTTTKSLTIYNNYTDTLTLFITVSN